MPFILPPVGLAGWLFQSTWAPQHLMSAACVITAMLLVVQYAWRQSLALLVTLVLVVAAGFESSTYVGGVTFAIAALVSAPILLTAIEPGRRARFTIGLAVAAVLAAALAAPFIVDQIAAVAARGGGPPIVIGHFEILGDMFPPLLRRLLDLPAYWLLLLPIEFPATFVAGSIALAVVLRGAKPGPEKTATAVLAALTGVGLCAPWLLFSTLGDNNDLGLRAVLPAAMVLIVATAVGMMLASRRTAILAVALGGLILGLPGAVSTIRSNIDDRRSPAQIDDDLQVDPELAEGPASSSRIALFAVGIAVVLGLVFYGLNNSSTNRQNAATAPAPATAQNTNSSPPPAPPGMRDVTPRSPNTGPGTTTGAAPANPQTPSPASNSPGRPNTNTANPSNAKQ